MMTLAKANSSDEKSTEKTAGAGLEEETRNEASDLSTTNAPNTADNKPEEKVNAMAAYKRIFSFNGRTENTILGIGLLSAFTAGVAGATQHILFGAFITVIIEHYTGDTSSGELRNKAAELALFFFIIGLAKLMLGFTWNTCIRYFAFRTTRNIRRIFIQAALAQEVAFYDRSAASASVAAQAAANGREIQNGIGEKLGLLVQGIGTFIAGYVIGFLYHWRLALMLIWILPAMVAVSASAGAAYAKKTTELLVHQAKGAAFAESVLACARTTHAFSIREKLVDKYDGYLTKAHAIGKTINPYLAILFAGTSVLIYLAQALAFWQGIRIVARGDLENQGDIFVVMLAIVFGSIGIASALSYTLDYSRAGVAAAELFAIIDRKSDIDPYDSSGAVPSTVTGHITLEKVSFAYPTRPSVPILHDFSLQIPDKKVTALVGPSGSGKSTIVGLLERWYRTDAGSLRIDGRPIADLNLRWLRQNVRLVQQEPILFSGSVFDNIKEGLIGTPAEHASEDEQMVLVKEAARVAFAHDFIQKLPEQYHTQIGERGRLLSGGEKQRVAIARSIVSGPTILLLDEATSALDPRAEKVVQQALDAASVGRTTIVIAHKLATIRRAHNIVVMAHGRIMEQGTHEELAAAQGLYARLIKIQNLNDVSTIPGAEEEEAVMPQNAAAAVTDGDGLKDGSSHALFHHDTKMQTMLKTRRDHGNYSLHQQLGVVPTITQLIKQTPEIHLQLLINLLASLIVGVLLPIQGYVLADILEIFSMTPSEMRSRGDFLAGMFVVIAGGALVGWATQGWVTNLTSQTLSHRLRTQAFDDMLRQDVQFYDQADHTTGGMLSTIDSNAQSVVELLGLTTTMMLGTIATVLGCVLLAFAFSWQISLVTIFGGLVPIVVISFLKIRIEASLNRDVDKRLLASSTIVSEAMSAIRTVASLTSEAVVLDKYTAELDKNVIASRKKLLVVAGTFAVSHAMDNWILALIFWYGTRLYSFNELTLREFIVAGLSLFYGCNSAFSTLGFTSSIATGLAAANHSLWLHNLQPKIRDTDENRGKGPQAGAPLAFSDTSFSYPLRPNVEVLKGINLTIQKGQLVGLVGGSGCGKSTVVALLERFYDPTTGTISIAGDNIMSLDPRSYRSTLGLVQQEPTLFQGSVRENVALGFVDDSADAQARSTWASVAAVSDVRIEAALRAANAWDFVSSLPDGLATQAGINGTQLSGGQRQRIAIARALIRRPGILLLDEATSALDTDSERIIQQALAAASRDEARITVAVAHRLSTIRNADVVYVLHEGRVREVGTHEDLYAKGGIYRQMCEAQGLD